MRIKLIAALTPLHCVKFRWRSVQ